MSKEYKKRPCGPRVSKSNPDAYNKDELVALAVADLGIKKSIAKGMTKDQLCSSLSTGTIVKKTSRKVSKKVSRKRSKKVSKSSQVFERKEGNCVERSLIPLKKHQEAVIKILKKRRGLIAIHSVGSGKTLTAVTASQCYLDSKPNNKVIVVTPTSLQTNFKKEMIKYGVPDDDDRYKFYTVKNFMNASSRGEINCKKSMLIVDEAHNLRTEVKTTKTTGELKAGRAAMSLVECAKNADKVLLLTATPAVNKPYDMANLLAMVDGDDQLSKKDFEKLIKDPDDLYSLFACKTSFYTPQEKEYKEFYPKMKSHDVFLPMTKKYYKNYLEVEDESGKDYILELLGEGNLKVFYNGVRRASNNLEEENSPKINWIMSKIEESDSKDKFVIFSHFLAAGMKLIMDRLDAEDIPYAHIDGSMNIEKRKKVVDDYNDNKIKVLLISKAGGEGLDLKETSNIIITEPSWNETTIKQVIGRGVRYKSHENLPKDKQQVDVWHLYLIKPREKSILKFLKDDLVTEPIDEEMLSVDLYLRNLSLKKQEVLDAFLEELKEISIEKLKC